MVSYGGVHSHIDHVRALLELARREGMEERTFIHAFTDGRDVSPTSAVDDLAELPVERIATVVGRYYAMDRDERWERTEKALGALVEGPTGSPPEIRSREFRRSYEEDVTDEFIEPIAIEGRPRLAPEDAVIFFNFRPDRGRQLTQKLLASGFDVTTMTSYRDDFDVPVAFAEQEVTDTVAEVLSEHGVLNCTSPRRRSTPTSRISSTADAKRSGPARRESSSRRRGMSRATTTSPRCRPAR